MGYIHQKRFTQKQIIGILKIHENGISTKEIIRQYNMFEQTVYQWKSKYVDMKISKAKRLKQLEDENQRLTHIIADLTLDNQALKLAVQKKNYTYLQKTGKPNTVETPNVPWPFDFVSDALENGCNFRVLTVIDEATRECLALEMDTSLSRARVVNVLNQIAFFRGFPQEILTDNGSEFTSCALSKWSYDKKIHHIFIKPGKPVENAYTESFNGKFR